MRSKDIEDWKGEVGDGWWPIVEELGLAMFRLDPDLEIHQIKEKFGGLRFYYSSSEEHGCSEEQKILVHFAERLCARTCETCGLPGSLRNDLGWVLTLCDSHHDTALDRTGRNRAEPT